MGHGAVARDEPRGDHLGDNLQGELGTLRHLAMTGADGRHEAAGPRPLRDLGARLTALLGRSAAAGLPDSFLDPLWEAAQLLQPLNDGVEPAAEELADLADRIVGLLARLELPARRGTRGGGR